jgi:hypothetical protein
MLLLSNTGFQKIVVVHGDTMSVLIAYEESLLL